MRPELLGLIAGFLAAFIAELLPLFHKRKPQVQAPVPEPAPVPPVLLPPVDDKPSKKHREYHFKSLDYLRGSVRPVLTYAFFLMFLFLKINAYEHAIWHDNLSPLLAITKVWDEGAAELFGAVIGFWFGRRAATKAKL